MDSRYSYSLYVSIHSVAYFGSSCLILATVATRIEKYGTAREYEKWAARSDNPWATAKASKKPKPKTPPEGTQNNKPTKNMFNPLATETSSPGTKTPHKHVTMNERPSIIAQPIKILQLNVQCKKHTTIQLLNNFPTEIDILLLQEPAWSFIGRDQTSGRDIDGPVALKGWSTILPVTSRNPNSPRPRTLTYFRPRNDFTITLRTDLLEDRDAQVLEINQANHPSTLIINVYNDSPKGDLCILNKLRDVYDSFPNSPTLITGNFNLHHPIWSRKDRALDHDQLSTSIAEWLTQKNFTLLNTRGEITHLARHAGERPSVIDLSFANAKATRLDTFKQWAVDPGLTLDSDHNAIKFILDHGLQEIPDYFPIKYNLNKVDTEDWSKTFDSELNKMEHTLTPLLNSPDLTNEQLDTYTDLLSSVIQNTLAMTAQERKPSPNAKPWWDKELDNASANPGPSTGVC